MYYSYIYIYFFSSIYVYIYTYTYYVYIYMYIHTYYVYIYIYIHKWLLRWIHCLKLRKKNPQIRQDGVRKSAQWEAGRRLKDLGAKNDGIRRRFDPKWWEQKSWDDCKMMAKWWKKPVDFFWFRKFLDGWNLKNEYGWQGQSWTRSKS